MVDAVSTMKPLPKFTTVKYTTKDGENVTVTKQGDTVTLSGDKNGIRQMPLEDFLKKELPENVANIKLENSPEADTVEIASKSNLDEGAKKVSTDASPQKAEDDKSSVGKKLDVAA